MKLLMSLNFDLTISFLWLKLSLSIIASILLNLSVSYQRVVLLLIVLSIDLLFVSLIDLLPGLLIDLLSSSLIDLLSSFLINNYLLLQLIYYLPL